MAKFQKLWILCLIGLIASLSAAKAEDTSDSEYPDDEEPEDTEDDDSSNGPMSITTEPQIFTVDPGQKVEFPCRGENLASVIWQKGSNQILTAGELVLTDDKRFMLMNTDLIIENVIANDTNDYKCKASISREVAVIHKLRVNDRPRAVVKDATKVVKDGVAVTLECDVTGYPEPTVTWERKGKKMPSGETNIEGSELTFGRVSRHHSGTYECVAQNELGAARTAISLVVTHAPEIEVEKESVHSGQGYDAELVCIVHAEPKAHVSWYKDGRPLDPRHGTEERQKHSFILHLKNVQKVDFGNYTCVANNTFGRSNKSIFLTEAPSQPQLKEEYLGKDHLSYTVVWSSESAFVVDEAKIRFRKSEEDWQEIMVTAMAAQPHLYTVTYTFRDLISSSDYEVTMSAHNQFGWSIEARRRKFHINGDYRSFEEESEPGAKEAIGSGSAGRLWQTSSLLSQVSFALLVIFVNMRRQ